MELCYLPQYRIKIFEADFSCQSGITQGQVGLGRLILLGPLILSYPICLGQDTVPVFKAGKSTPYPICPGLAGVVQSVLQVSASRQKLESRLALWVTGQYYLVLIEIIPMSSFRLYYDVMLYISRPTLFLVLNDNPPPQIMQAAANIIQDVSLMYVIVD